MSEQAKQGAQATVAPGVARVGYAPITRVDAERREIELCATSEALDAHGTIFDYAASKDAFTRWEGNVREMHERRAVGRRVGVRCDDEARRIYVQLRISHGAQDTWEKVVDGTLRGASIGANDVTWRRERRVIAGRTRWVNIATRYDLAELSLVDNPSNPDALGVVFVRDATPDVTLLDPLDRAEPQELAKAETRAQTPEEESPPTHDEHDERNPLHDAARTLLAGCGCLRCMVALATLADGATEEAGEPGEVDNSAQRTVDMRHDALTQALAAGLRLHAARLEQFDMTLTAAVAALQRQAERRGPAAQESDEADGQAARVVEELRARVERLEAQPIASGPAARPVEKTLGGYGAVVAGLAAGDEVRALEALAGRLRDPQAQLAVAAEMIRLQQRPNGD